MPPAPRPSSSTAVQVAGRLHGTLHGPVPTQPAAPLPSPAGLFVDVENGTEVLQLAVRRDVADLSLAHRIYDNMRATQR